MKKIYQTKFGKPDGNCMNACLASLLDINIDDIPEFKDEHWQDKYNEWLISNYGLYLLTIVAGGYLPKCFNDTVSIGIGMSKDGLHHAVLVKGNKIIHDPLPDSGVGVIERYDLLVKYFDEI